MGGQAQRGGAVLRPMPYDKVLGASNLSMLRYGGYGTRNGNGFSKRQPSPAEKVRTFWCSTRSPRSIIRNSPTASHTPDAHQQRHEYQLRKFVRQGSGSSDGRRYPGNVLFVPTVMGGIHPTQKPVELCEYFIKTYTDEGAVVGYCAGSGTRRWRPSIRPPLHLLKTPRPSGPPPGALSRHGWPWSVVGKECNYRSIFHHLRRSPVALLPKGLAGGGGASLPHHEH